MAEAPLSRFPVPDLSSLPQEVREAIENVTTKTGFTPNVFLAYAWKPEHFRAFFTFYEVLMRGASGLSRPERELVALAASAANDCLY